MSYSRPEAVAEVARFARGILDPQRAKAIASACGVSFDVLLYIEPRLVRKEIKGAYVQKEALGQDLVLMAELGAVICRSLGLYADGDHAMSSPHGTPGKQADYIGQRAAIRLARHWWGDVGVDELRARVPWLRKDLLAERPFAPQEVSLGQL